MNQKMIIFEKLNHALACTKIVIFTFIFALHFSNSFKHRSDTSSFAVTTTTINHSHHNNVPLLPQMLFGPQVNVFLYQYCLINYQFVVITNDNNNINLTIPFPYTTTNVVGGMVMVSQWCWTGVSARRMNATSAYRVDWVLMASSHTLLHVGQRLFLQWALHISIPIFVSTKEYNYIHIYYFRTIRLKY